MTSTKGPVAVPGLTHHWVPGDGSSGKLLVALHGRGDSLKGFAWLASVLGLPGLNYLLLNAPDPWYGGFSWYDLPPNQAPGVMRSRELLFGALDALAGGGWASSDIILSGFSQGGLMAIDVGLRYPRPLAGVVCVSGYVMFPERAAAEATPHAKTMPWLITHGTADEVLPIETTRDQVATLRAAGLPVEWVTYDKGHTIDLDAELPAMRDWMAARLRA